jgi:hypothetical protein
MEYRELRRPDLQFLVVRDYPGIPAASFHLVADEIVNYLVL